MAGAWAGAVMGAARNPPSGRAWHMTDGSVQAWFTMSVRTHPRNSAMAQGPTASRPVEPPGPRPYSSRRAVAAREPGHMSQARGRVRVRVGSGEGSSPKSVEARWREGGIWVMGLKWGIDQ